MQGEPLTLNDLSSGQKFILGLIGDNPDEKHVRMALREANYLASLGLAQYCGCLRFELTPAGMELYHERKALFNNQHTSEENITKSRQDFVIT